ncbi:MAG: bifunctional DNA-formamidopyrimidine glycosylase/DNA-(apurinic or apyrimidinic site) lyase [Lentisphaeria bacterium]|nr:bifunctional DNA-formamidopyrimidine glycosylase/DNA-(apurinic or apyrimidinic site) lyase [Lentisphaeria bacterium]
MPELPEVETVFRALQPHVEGQTIQKALYRSPKLRHKLTTEDSDLLNNKTIQFLHRRAKYILIELGNHEGILLHLGMTGSMRIEDHAAPFQKHDHTCLFFENGKRMIFNDPRRFGIFKYWNKHTKTEVQKGLQKLAPEPFDDAFTINSFIEKSKKSTKPIKNFIMDSRYVVGVGNIYASESLFRSGIRPTRKANKCTRKSLTALHGNMIEVLREAIQLGGTSISDFRTVDGSEGKFTQNLFVYGLEGEPCRKCENLIKRIVQSGRSTFYCPNCQK